MRNEIVHIGAGELNYEIRNIIKVVEKVKALGYLVHRVLRVAWVA